MNSTQSAQKWETGFNDKRAKLKTATKIANSWFPPSRNVGNVGNVRNLVNVGRWRNGHTLRTLRENMETNYSSDSYWSTATASTWKIEIDSIPTDFT